ncbi:hypothetical protein IJ579_03035 [bacterium]|nr:hypothetical protein [bacterium]
MKKILILSLLIFSGSFVMASCPLSQIQTGAACNITADNNLDITPDTPSNTNIKIPNPNKNKYTPDMEKPSPVQDLGATSPSQNNSPSGPYNSNCQFGVCPPKVNNQGFNK